MQKLLSRIYFSPLLIILLIYAIVFSSVKELLLLFMMDIIHELGHWLTYIIFKVPVYKFSLHIYGCSLECENIEYLKPYKQIVIALAGPLTLFISYGLLLILLKNEILTVYEYRVNMNNNICLALFNMLPIYPMDGGRVMDVCYRLCTPVKECFKIRAFWSILCGLLIIYPLVVSKQFILLIMIISFLISYLANVRKEYLYYLVDRSQRNIQFPNVVNTEENIYHFKNNIFLKNGYFFEEKAIVAHQITLERKKAKKVLKKTKNLDKFIDYEK